MLSAASQEVFTLSGTGVVGQPDAQLTKRTFDFYLMHVLLDGRVGDQFNLSRIKPDTRQSNGCSNVSVFRELHGRFSCGTTENSGWDGDTCQVKLLLCRSTSPGLRWLTTGVYNLIQTRCAC
ncbi:hypothetical protein PPS11_01809 [Pseudomonas putida S11]|nr:hypothetical protein PPS11_01809 [Pseudomonas putida S11]